MTRHSSTKSANLELISIYFVVFGLSFISSVSTAFLGGPQTYSLDNNALGYLVTVEIITGALALFILSRRGWSLSQFNLNPSSKQTLCGLLILIADYLIYYLTVTGLKILGLFKSSELIVTDISLLTALITAFVNPLFEEFFVVAYTIERSENLHGKYFALTLSAFVRFLYHMYQGPIAIWIFFVGLLHGYVYLRWRKLWPLVVGHGILNFISFCT